MRHGYGTCFVRYAKEETEVYIKYYETLGYNNLGQQALIFVCEDLITGTPLRSLPLLGAADDAYDAAKKNQLKKNHLIAYSIDYVEKEDMIEMLKSMDDAKIKEYVGKIENAKSEYKEAIKKAKQDKKEQARLARKEARNLDFEMGNEIGRIKGIVKRLIKG